NSGGGGAVIDLVVGADHGRHRGRGDISGRVGRGVGGVIDRVSAADRNAADADALGCANVWVGETGGGVGGRETVAGHAIVGEGDRGAGGAIIDLVYPGSCYAQRAGSDVGGGAGGGIGSVVARVNATDADAADTDAFGGAGILAGEG